MSIIRYAGDRFAGYSSDIKPTGLLSGALFLELDTRGQYVYLVEQGWVVISGQGTITYSGSGNGSGSNFIDDGTFVRTTGNQNVSGVKTFYNNLYELGDGIGIGTTGLRGPFDILVGGTIGTPTGFAYLQTFDYNYNLWDSTDVLTFEIFAYNNSFGEKVYSAGLSGAITGASTYNWFKADLAWSGVSGAEGYRILFGGDTTNDRYRDWYMDVTGTTLSYGIDSNVLYYNGPPETSVPPQASYSANFYVNPSGDLITTRDIYCRYIYAENLTGITGGGGGTGSANYPTGGLSGQHLKKATNATNDVIWGDILNPYILGSPTGNVTIDFLSGQLQTINLGGTTSFSTLNRQIGRFVSVKMLASGANRSITFNSDWGWLGQQYPTGITLTGGTNAVLSLTCYGPNETDLLGIFRYTDDLRSGVSTEYIDANYYPRSNPSGYITGVTGSAATFPTGGLSGQLLKKATNANSDVVWGDVLNPYTLGTGSGSLVISFLSGQLQTANLVGTTSFTTAGRQIARFSTVKMFASGANRNVTFSPSWAWLGDSFTTGLTVLSGTNAFLALTCYGSNETDIVAICRYTNDSPTGVTTGWVDQYYYPRTNPTGYITSGWVDQYYYPRTNPTGYITSGFNNFLTGGVSGQVLTKNSSANYDTSWSTPTTPVIGRSMFLCSAYTPGVTGIDNAEIIIPHDTNGTSSLAWTVRRLSFRVQTSGIGQAITIQKSTGVGAFTPITVGSISIASGMYESGITTGLGTLNSNDKVRFVTDVVGTATNWTIGMEISYP